MIATAIIQALSVLVRWIPVRAVVIHEYEQGVRWWRGRATRLITTSGIRWYVPWIGDITTDSTVPQEVETNLQAIEDADGYGRSISFGLQYEIFNLLHKETKVTDFDESLLNLVERLACEAIQSDDPDPLAYLLDEVQVQCREWGVQVHHLGSINNAQARPIHLLQND